MQRLTCGSILHLCHTTLPYPRYSCRGDTEHLVPPGHCLWGLKLQVKILWLPVLHQSRNSLPTFQSNHQVSQCPVPYADENFPCLPQFLPLEVLLESFSRWSTDYLFPGSTIHHEMSGCSLAAFQKFPCSMDGTSISSGEWHFCHTRRLLREDLKTVSKNL